MAFRSKVALVLLCVLGCPFVAFGGQIKSYTDVLGGTVLADFEGFAEGTLIGSGVYSGVTFGQDVGGRPQIDNYLWLFGYGSSSGSGVLTGSTEGGDAFPTVAGITMTFDTPLSAVEIFLSDTAPLGDYPIQIFGAGDVLLDSFTVLGSEILPPGYAGGLFPPPGTFPLPGIYVGFTRATADIVKFQIGRSTASADAFAVDDLRVVPEPSSVFLLFGGIGLIGLGLRKRRQA